MTPMILGMQVASTTYDEATENILAWAKSGESRYVCVANVHMVMEAHDHPDFREIVNAADLVVPDGMPLVWMLRWMGFPGQERVYGPELTLRLVASAARAGIPVGFYGASPQALERILANFRQRFPSLQIAYAYSPPFRPLTPEEDEEVVRDINVSGTRILFVGLGCPKQERWMALHKGRVLTVMVGVGAAFDFHAGIKPQAPSWMQRAGLEWLFRFVTEPRRLWRRYVYHNPRFIVLAGTQLVRRKLGL